MKVGNYWFLSQFEIQQTFWDHSTNNGSTTMWGTPHILKLLALNEPSDWGCITCPNTRFTRQSPRFQFLREQETKGLLVVCASHKSALWIHGIIVRGSGRPHRVWLPGSYKRKHESFCNERRKMMALFLSMQPHRLKSSLLKCGNKYTAALNLSQSHWKVNVIYMYFT